jgi:hypothetical protein
VSAACWKSGSTAWPRVGLSREILDAEATDLNNHTGHDTADEGGARIARRVTTRDPATTGAFLSADGGISAW